MRITVVAFTDNGKNSVAYKNFDNIEKAAEFYKSMLEKDDVNVVSTRKVKEK